MHRWSQVLCDTLEALATHLARRNSAGGGEDMVRFDIFTVSGGSRTSDFSDFRRPPTLRHIKNLGNRIFHHGIPQGCVALMCAQINQHPYAATEVQALTDDDVGNLGSVLGATTRTVSAAFGH